MTKTDLQKKAKSLVRDDRLREAIDLIESFLNEKRISDKYFSEILITLSANDRNIQRLNQKGSIAYDDYKTDRSKIVQGLLSLIEEIPHLKIDIQNNKLNETKAVAALTIAQDKQFNDLRGEMLGSDRLIGNLIDQLREKESLIRQQSQDQIKFLRKQIIELEKRILEEETKYEKLRQGFEELKSKQAQLAELKAEIQDLKSKIEIKQNHIDILVKQQIWSEGHLREKSEMLKMKDQYISHLKEQLKLKKKKKKIAATNCRCLVRIYSPPLARPTLIFLGP